jgi:hypothetical protein
MALKTMKISSPKKSKKDLPKIKPLYFLVLAVTSGVICLFALRANNEHMIKLRSAVYSADMNDTNVSLALQQLQAYVTTNMNTDLSSGKGSVYPPIQLKYTYERLQQEESSQAAASNADLYTQAQNYCQAQIPTGFSGRYRVPCIEQYVEAHDSSLPAIPDALYKFDFVSPSWSPDLAGWSLLVTSISAVLFVLTFAATKVNQKL